MKKIRKGDDVMVLAGRDKGKRGMVLKVFDNGKALVNDVNIVKRHVKPNPNKGETGGIIEKESPIELSNLAVFNPHTRKGDRIGFKTLEDGTKVRFFKSDGEVVDV